MLLALWTRQSTLPPKVGFLVVAGFVAFFVLVIWAAARAKRKRREELEQFALESGFAYSPEADPGTTAQLAELKMSPVGVETRVRYENVLRGSRGGREVVMADRTTGGGKSQSTSTIVATRFSSPLPAFYLCAENVLFRIIEKLGFSDIDIESAPEFSRRYFLHGEKPDEVRALFSRDVTLMLEQLPNDATLMVMGSGPWLVVSKMNQLIPVQQLRELVETATRISEALQRGQTADTKW